MKRFVQHFYSWQDGVLVETEINNYAERNNLTIITIAPLYQNGIYVLFERSDNNGE